VGAERQRWIRRIHDGVWHLSALLDDLTQIAGLDRGEVSLQPVDAGQVLERVLGVLEAQVRVGARPDARDLSRDCPVVL
jgi:signal transduction histidine kinase